MNETKKRRGDVKGVGNQTYCEAPGFEDAPEDVIVAVEFARDSVAEMGEGNRAGFDGLEETFVGGVCVAEADFDAQGSCERDRSDGFEAFGR